MSLDTVTLLLSIYLGKLDYRRHGNGTRTVYIHIVILTFSSPLVLLFITFYYFFLCPSRTIILSHDK